jgi:hypothetical protein
MFGKAYNAIGSAFNKVLNPVANTVNSGVKIYKEIPEEHRAKIEAKASDLAKGTRTAYPPKVREFLEKYGDTPVETLQIVIEPLAPVVEMLANKMTKGEASAYAHQRGFDGFFHAGLLINDKYSIDKHKEGVYVGPNTFRGALNPKVKVSYHHINLTHLGIGSAPGNEEALPRADSDYNTGEQGFTGFYDNTVVVPRPPPRRRGFLADIDNYGADDQFFSPQSASHTAMSYPVPTVRHDTLPIFSDFAGISKPKPVAKLTINSMMEKTRAMLGDDVFYSYDLFTNNCCLFVMSVLKANGLLDSASERFVNQDIAGLGKKMPGWSSTVSKIFTDATNLVSIAQTGR